MRSSPFVMLRRISLKRFATPWMCRSEPSNLPHDATETKGASIAFFRGGDAFPSGHSIQAWALARVIAREFPQHRLFPILSYGLATTVSVARVAGRRHSPSDAFVGSAMGFFIGDYVYRHHHAPSPKANAA